jgi:hypothetical protein
MQLVKEVVDPRQRVPVLNSYVIQSSVIYTEAERAVLLLNEDDGRPIW